MTALSRCIFAALFAVPACVGNLAAADDGDLDLEHIEVQFVATSSLIRPATDMLSIPVVQSDIAVQFRAEQPPRAPEGFAPVFPYALLREGVKGNASVAAIIDAGGVVVKTCVRGATRPEFGEALVAALQATRFEPATADGRPTAVVLGVRHDFVPAGFGASVSRDERRLLELETKNPAAIARPASLDAPLRVARRVAPVFPQRETGPRPSGEATVEFLVDEDGHAHLPRVTAATEPDFGFAAVQAVAAWRFEKPHAAGRPAIVRVKVSLKFNAASDSTPIAKTP